MKRNIMGSKQSVEENRNLREKMLQAVQEEHINESVTVPRVEIKRRLTD